MLHTFYDACDSAVKYVQSCCSPAAFQVMWHSHAQRVMHYLVEKCDARLHWGKAGWPYLEPCFDGASHYTKWCDFGCAVQVRFFSMQVFLDIKYEHTLPECQ